MNVNEIKKLEKTLVQGFDDKVIDISVYLVQKCNFNDERLVENYVISKQEVDNKEFKWFDLYLSRNKEGKKIAFVYLSDNDVYFYLDDKGSNELIKLNEGSHIITDDYDENLIIACHINVFNKKYKKKELNITAGECLNEKMKQVAELWIPFNEDMSKGEVETELFSDAFFEERSKIHNVTVLEYKEKLSAFLNCLEELETFDKINLWFGEDACCLANVDFVYNCMINYGFKGELLINIVDEETTELKKRFIGNFSKEEIE